MRRVVGGIPFEGFPALDERQLLEPEIVVDSREIGAANRAILVELEAGAIYRPVVVQLDRPLERLQCLDRLTLWRRMAS
jgi:hypothetical protein